MTLEHLAHICIGNPGALDWIWGLTAFSVGALIFGLAGRKRGYRRAQRDRDNELHVDALDQRTGASHG